MSRFQPPTPWEWSVFGVAIAITLDFLLDLQATYYLGWFPSNPGIKNLRVGEV